MAYVRLADQMRVKVRRRMAAGIEHDMKSCRQTANDVLLANLRKAMPKAELPSINVVPADAMTLWFPVYDRWALAVDQAMRELGLGPIHQDSDADDAVRRLLERARG